MRYFATHPRLMKQSQLRPGACARRTALPRGSAQASRPSRSTRGLLRGVQTCSRTNTGNSTQAQLLLGSPLRRPFIRRTTTQNPDIGARRLCLFVSKGFGGIEGGGAAGGVEAEERADGGGEAER